MDNRDTILIFLSKFHWNVMNEMFLIAMIDAYGSLRGGEFPFITAKRANTAGKQVFARLFDIKFT